jgi:hypothetical protein
MKTPILPKSPNLLARPVWSVSAGNEFKPIGRAALLVLAKLALRLDANRANADLQSGGLE